MTVIERPFIFYSELEQLQNEKRKALLEHETQKLRECDDSLQRELREWKAQLLPRKQVRRTLEGAFCFIIRLQRGIVSQSR